MASNNLDKAKKRLEKAVARLESLSRDGAAAASAHNAELDSLREENVVLRDMADSVSGRLDTAIGRIKGILES